MNSNKNLLIGFLIIPFTGGPMIVFEIYIMSWLMGFYNPETGPLYEMDEVFKLYQLQGILGCTFAFVLLGFVGRLVDKFSVRYVLPLSLMIRGLIFSMVWKIKDPTHWSFYLAVPLTHVSYYIVVMTNNAYISKMYPKEIRGMCNSVGGIFGTLGSFMYLNYAQTLYKQGKGLPFVGVTALDFITAIFCIIMMMFGFFADPSVIEPKQKVLPEEEKHKRLQ